MTTPREELTSFLSTLWPELSSLGHWLLFWGAPSKGSEWTQAITPAVLDGLEKWAEKDNVYVGCALRAQNFGPTLRGERADCSVLPGVYLDVDWGVEHKKQNLPPTEEDAFALIDGMGLPPTMVVHSGRGLQAWWCFREPWLLETDEDRSAAERLTKGWCSTLKAHAKARGWDADQVGDLPRVMRLPGLWNRKGVPRQTKLLRLTEARYNPAELEPYLLNAPTEKDATPSLTWKFTLSVDANPPADKFVALLDLDYLFKSSWYHARTDLQDQSPSSYDLSLATRAFAAEWTEQEIVDLLVAHRRKYKADPEKTTRRDYYDRTLSKAISGKDQEARKDAIEALKAGKSLPEPTPDDPAGTLAMLSDALGVKLSKLVRFRGGSNSYQLHAENHVIDVPDVEILDTQSKFRRLLLDYTDRRIKPMKEHLWHDIVQRLFSAVENVQVANDATRRGAFENWLDLYLSESVASQANWERAAGDNQPFEKDGRVFFVSEGFRLFLYTRFQERITSQQLTVELTKLGYVYERKTVRTRKGGSTKRSLWRVP